MRTTTIQPHPALRPYINRYLTLDVDLPAPMEQCVGPSGGPVLVVLLEGAQEAGVLGGVLGPMPRAYLLGQLDRAALNRLHGRVRAFMVQFTTVGAYALFGLSVRTLTNQAIELGALSLPELTSAADALTDASDDAERAAAVDRTLLARLSSTSATACGPDRTLDTVKAALQLIADARGQLPVSVLSQKLAVTPRTLLRHFDEAVGLPVRSYSRLVRFQSARRESVLRPTAAWSELAFRFNYVDQSHLIRDFHRYCGESPSAFRARQHQPRLMSLMA